MNARNAVTDGQNGSDLGHIGLGTKIGNLLF